MVVKGPKGTLRVPVPRGVLFEKQDGQCVVRRESDDQTALHGLARSLLANAVRGVAQGFERHLDIVGIGYRAEVKGPVRAVHARLFASHPNAHSAGTERHGRKADASGDQRRRQTAGRTVGGGNSRFAASGSLQEQGCPLHGRTAEEEGRQGSCGSRGSCKGRLVNGPRTESAICCKWFPRTRRVGGSMFEFEGERTGERKCRGSASSVPPIISTHRSWMTCGGEPWCPPPAATRKFGRRLRRVEISRRPRWWDGPGQARHRRRDFARRF